MAGAGGPQLPMLLAHHLQLHVVAPFSFPNITYIGIVRLDFCIVHGRN